MHTSLSNTSMRQRGKRLFGLALVLTVSALADNGRFPVLSCETLSGKHLTMPAAAQQSPALFIIGFTRGSSEQTSYWAKHLPKDLVATYTVAVLEDAPRLIRRVAVHSIKSGVPKELHDHFLIVYDNEKELKEAAQFQAPDEAYLLLVAPNGSIQWRFHGAFTHTALKGLRDQVRLDQSHGDAVHGGSEPGMRQ